MTFFFKTGQILYMPNYPNIYVKNYVINVHIIVEYAVLFMIIMYF